MRRVRQSEEKCEQPEFQGEFPRGRCDRRAKKPRLIFEPFVLRCASPFFSDGHGPVFGSLLFRRVPEMAEARFPPLCAHRTEAAARVPRQDCVRKNKYTNGHERHLFPSFDGRPWPDTIVVRSRLRLQKGCGREGTTHSDSETCHAAQRGRMRK